MRKKEKIIKEIDKILKHRASQGTNLAMQVLTMEVLFDIRELLNRLVKANLGA